VGTNSSVRSRSRRCIGGLGECQYRLGRYKDALDSFSKVGSYNSLSPKLAASAFKIGQTYSKLGDYERARLMFKGVLDQYPDGAEAKLARKAIDGITPKIKNMTEKDPTKSPGLAGPF
jgi:tetratricopeptide (TPR) repeat protein